MRAQIGLWRALFMASVKMFIRNRTALFFSLFLPLIIMLIFGVLNFEGTTTIELGVVDEAGTDASAAFIDGLREYDYLELTTGDRESELAALEAGDRGFVLVIPSDFEPSLGGETGPGGLRVDVGSGPGTGRHRDWSSSRSAAHW